jgi:hypothetical protein
LDLEKTPLELYLQAIVPEDPRDNPKDDCTTYNERVLLLAAVLEPIAHRSGVEFVLEEPHTEISKYVPAEVADRLRSFSRAAVNYGIKWQENYGIICQP